MPQAWNKGCASSAIFLPRTPYGGVLIGDHQGTIQELTAKSASIFRIRSVFLFQTPYLTLFFQGSTAPLQPELRGACPFPLSTLNPESSLNNHAKAGLPLMFYGGGSTGGVGIATTRNANASCTLPFKYVDSFTFGFAEINSFPRSPSPKDFPILNRMTVWWNTLVGFARIAWSARKFDLLFTSEFVSTLIPVAPCRYNDRFGDCCLSVEGLGKHFESSRSQRTRSSDSG